MEESHLRLEHIVRGHPNWKTAVELQIATWGHIVREHPNWKTVVNELQLEAISCKTESLRMNGRAKSENNHEYLYALLEKQTISPKPREGYIPRPKPSFNTLLLSYAPFWSMITHRKPCLLCQTYLYDDTMAEAHF